MQIFYNIFIYLLSFGMEVGALFNQKLKSGIEGRRQSFEKIKNAFSKNDKIIWMHAASLGEYEQGLPVLQRLKEQFPQSKILITFFSPSGYENVIKKDKWADAICYLPLDFKKDIQKFTSHFQTEIFFTIKYDFWYHLFEELKRQNAKIYVVSALFYPKQVFFKAYGKYFVNQLKKNVSWFFHQTENSYRLAKSIGLDKASISGDTRFDRVKQIKHRDNFVDFIDEFKQAKLVIVFGSSWETEEKIAKQILEHSQNIKIIIAPHDLKRVEYLKKLFHSAILYSEIQHSISNIQHSKILIIDSIGLLSKIYSYADLAVVGGGFHDKGLHNILEACTFGIPVFFGNQYKKNPEADELIARKGGKSFSSELETTSFLLSLLKDENLRKAMGENAGQFVHSQPQSTEIILEKILSDFKIN